MKQGFVLFAKKCLVPVLRPFIKEIKGAENIPSDTNFILAANHQSNFDHFFIPFPLKDRLKKVHFIGKMDNILQFLFAGWFYWLAETIPVNRKAKDKRKVLEKALDVLEKGEAVIIYPEGTRNKEKNIMEGKTGAAELAIRSGKPVLPAALIYNGNKPRNFPVSINIGKQIVFDKKEDFDYEDLRIATDKIMEEIYFLSGKKNS
jgi:1-acyl-sn-glycerol-3-phosphate acyltransferase